MVLLLDILINEWSGFGRKYMFDSMPSTNRHKLLNWIIVRIEIDFDQISYDLSWYSYITCSPHALNYCEIKRHREDELINEDTIYPTPSSATHAPCWIEKYKVS